MRIALLAPFEERVPPRGYGGVEAVVHTLAVELHRMGHDVTVFASGDSDVPCRLIPIVPKAFGSAISKRLREAYTYRSLIAVVEALKKERFDIVHNHIGWQPFLFNGLIRTPMLTTIHWVLDNTCEHTMYELYKSMPYVSISNSQRTPLPDINYLATVYHGLQLERFPYSDQPKDYLAYLGRFSPVKGPVEAIKIAKKTGHKLIMAAKINTFERDFYEAKIKPHIDGEQIVYLGEIGHKEKVALLRGAKALLSPIKWSEPFGLTNIEAMACGTPVISSRLGSLPEIILHGKTGFLCKDVASMVKSVAKIPSIDRAACRAHVEAHFNAEQMTKQYIELYTQVVEDSLRKKQLSTAAV
jgi:glycosyltransferase involved in cell wall biosynthesis